MHVHWHFVVMVIEATKIICNKFWWKFLRLSCLFHLIIPPPPLLYLAKHSNTPAPQLSAHLNNTLLKFTIIKLINHKQIFKPSCYSTFFFNCLRFLFYEVEYIMNIIEHSPTFLLIGPLGKCSAPYPNNSAIWTVNAYELFLNINCLWEMH